MSYENVEIETRGKVGIIRLNRPQALNALNAALIADLSHAVDAFEASSAIGCIVITGSEKAFAAGADIKEMAGKTYMDAFMGDFAAQWDRVARARKPVIAAVRRTAWGSIATFGLSRPITAAALSTLGRPRSGVPWMTWR